MRGRLRAIGMVKFEGGGCWVYFEAEGGRRKEKRAWRSGCRERGQWVGCKD